MVWWKLSLKAYILIVLGYGWSKQKVNGWTHTRRTPQEALVSVLIIVPWPGRSSDAKTSVVRLHEGGVGGGVEGGRYMSTGFEGPAAVL